MAIPTIQNIPMANFNGAYEATLPKDMSNITLQLRGLTATLRFAFAPGLVNGASPVGPYGTVNPGKAFSFPLSVPSGGGDAATKIYLSSDTSGQVCEIITS